MWKLLVLPKSDHIRRLLLCIHAFHFLIGRTPKRIYFLAVDTQEEMKTWARMVCDACGLRSAPDDEEENGK